MGSSDAGPARSAVVIDATTRVAAVIGDPIGHSLSPRIHNAAFAAARLDWVYVAFPVQEGDGGAAVRAMRSLGLGGLSVTMPHKAAVIAELDAVEDDAAALGAVNCIYREGARLVGANTDGVGFVEGLRADHGMDPTGQRCVVLGAGGAARAVVLALARSGAASVGVVNRTRSTADAAATLAGAVGAVVGEGAVAQADLVVNATPLGMERKGAAEGELPCDPELLRPGQVVVDLIYHPPRTRLLDEAEARGASTSNGLSMLVHQAGAAFERWTGTPAPLDAMRAAVVGEGGTEPPAAKS